MDTNFSEWLTAKMRDKDWTQSELARVSGLSRQAISYYLSDKSKQPDEYALQKLAKAFRVPYEQAYRAAGILPPTPNEDEWLKEMMHKINSLSPDLRPIAEGLLDTLLGGKPSSAPKTKPKPKTKPSRT